MPGSLREAVDKTGLRVSSKETKRARMVVASKCRRFQCRDQFTTCSSIFGTLVRTRRERKGGQPSRMGGMGSRAKLPIDNRIERYEQEVPLWGHRKNKVVDTSNLRK